MFFLVIIALGFPAVSAWVKEMENIYYQGDMILSPEEENAITNGNHRYGAIIGKRWPKVGNYVVVPYDYDESIRTITTAIQGIQLAMMDYEKYTCIRFKRRTGSENNYIMFVSSAGCASSVGMRHKSQKVHLGSGCWNKATVIHELGHAMGFWHEQSRPDRDQYVKINWENIVSSMKFNFDKNSNVDSLGSPYDYRSVMHYDATAFGRSSVTIETLDPYYRRIIGTGNGFSKTDIKQLNLMYKCPVYTGLFPERQPTDKCSDTDKHCYLRVAKKGCSDSYVKRKCRFTCNLCATEKGTDALPTLPSVTIPAKWTPVTTQDPNPNCPPDIWANCKDVKSYCGSTGSWGDKMKINCRKTCNFCGESSTTHSPTDPTNSVTTRPNTSVTSNPLCKNTLSNCKELKAFCNKPGWEVLKKRCKQTCNLC